MIRASNKALIDLGKRVSASAPPGQEQTETDSLEYSGDSTDRHGIKRPLLGKDLTDKLQLRLAMELIEEFPGETQHTLGAELAKKIKVPR